VPAAADRPTTSNLATSLVWRTHATFGGTIESDLEVIQKQFARLPTRRELARTALGIIFAR
jgi:hypothetical protein